MDIGNPVTRTTKSFQSGGIFALKFTKGQCSEPGEHWAWRLSGNCCSPTERGFYHRVRDLMTYCPSPSRSCFWESIGGGCGLSFFELPEHVNPLAGPRGYFRPPPGASRASLETPPAVRCL